MVYKAVKKLCDKKGVSVYKLEQELGFAASTILKWKKSIPTADKLKAVADYFKVPMEVGKCKESCHIRTGGDWKIDLCQQVSGSCVYRYRRKHQRYGCGPF